MKDVLNNILRCICVLFALLLCVYLVLQIVIDAFWIFTSFELLDEYSSLVLDVVKKLNEFI